MARCCGETALCMVGAKFDADHWRALIDDEIKSRKGRARLLLGNSHWLTQDQFEKPTGQIETMKTGWKRLSGLDYETIEQKGGVEIHYVIYRQLSADAAHASLESLFRYVTEADGTIESLQPAPKLSPDMISDTVDIACNFFFLCSAVAIEHFPDQTASAALEDCWQKYKVLAEKRGASSKQPSVTNG